MKTHRYLILAAVCFFLAGYAAHAQGAPTNVVTLAWDYPTNAVTADLVFKLYTTTILTNPVPWVHFTNTAGTNLKLSFLMEKEQRFWYCTASNWWGESDPSNVASTPAPPRSDLNLRIRKGL